MSFFYGIWPRVLGNMHPARANCGGPRRQEMTWPTRWDSKAFALIASGGAGSDTPTPHSQQRGRNGTARPPNMSPCALLVRSSNFYSRQIVME